VTERLCTTSGQLGRGWLRDSIVDLVSMLPESDAWTGQQTQQCVLLTAYMAGVQYVVASLLLGAALIE